MTPRLRIVANGADQSSLATEVKKSDRADASSSSPVAVPADAPCKSRQGTFYLHETCVSCNMFINTVKILLFMSTPVIPSMGEVV